MRYFTQIDCRNRGFNKRPRKVTGLAFLSTRASDGSASKNPGTDAGAGAGAGSLGGGDSVGKPSGDHSVDDSSSPVPSRGMEHSHATVAAAAPAASGDARTPLNRRDGWTPGTHIPEQVLVTTNDSRIRLYNTDDFDMDAKYKGFRNERLQISACFSEDGKQVISGSEDGKVS